MSRIKYVNEGPYFIFDWRLFSPSARSIPDDPPRRRLSLNAEEPPGFLQYPALEEWENLIINKEDLAFFIWNAIGYCRHFPSMFDQILVMKVLPKHSKSENCQAKCCRSCRDECHPFRPFDVLHAVIVPVALFDE
jgi:hypothetical protein